VHKGVHTRALEDITINLPPQPPILKIFMFLIVCTERRVGYIGCSCLCTGEDASNTAVGYDRAHPAET